MPDDGVLSGVFQLPFPEQIAAFRLRLGNLVPTARWDDIEGQAHDRAFMVAGAMKAELLADLAAAVDRGIAGGGTLDDFRRDFRAIVARHGWHGWTGEGTKAGEAWRTRVIWRTNMTTTWAAGRRAQLEAGNFAFWVYRHGGSREPRPQHLAWDGLALPPGHPFWATHAPPNGWGCSCKVYGARSEKGVRRLGGDPDKALPPGWDARDPRTGAPPGIDKGWAHAPGATVADEIIAQLRARAAKLPAPLADALGREIDEREGARAEAETRAMHRLLEDLLPAPAARQIIEEVRRAPDALLGPAEQAAILAYTKEGIYRPLNAALRARAAEGAAALSIEQAAFTAVLDRALARLPRHEGIVWRGIVDMPQERLWHLHGRRPGEVIAMNGFTSTSRSERKAFVGRVRLRIRSLSGRRIDALSDAPQEAEVLFGRGLQYRVVATRWEGRGRGKRLLVDLEEISPAEWQHLREDAMFREKPQPPDDAEGPPEDLAAWSEAWGHDWLTDRDGRPAEVPYIAEEAQARRWAALGFDLHAAIDRWRAWRAARRDQTDPHAVAAHSVAYREQETALAEAAGIGPADPDHWP